MICRGRFVAPVEGERSVYSQDSSESLTSNSSSRLPTIRPHIFVKDHTAGTMSTDYALHHSRFSSHALSLEAKFRELMLEHGHERKEGPVPAVVEESFNLLENIASRPGSYQKILLLLIEELKKAVFLESEESKAARRRGGQGRQHKHRGVEALFTDQDDAEKGSENSDSARWTPLFWIGSCSVMPGAEIARSGTRSRGTPYFALCHEVQYPPLYGVLLAHGESRQPDGGAITLSLVVLATLWFIAVPDVVLDHTKLTVAVVSMQNR